MNILAQATTHKAQVNHEPPKKKPKKRDQDYRFECCDIKQEIVLQQSERQMPKMPEVLDPHAAYTQSPRQHFRTVWLTF